MASSVLDTVKTKNETEIAKSVLDAFKANTKKSSSGSGASSSTTPATTVKPTTSKPTPSPAKTPSVPTPSLGKTPSPSPTPTPILTPPVIFGPKSAASNSSSAVETNVQGSTSSKSSHGLALGAIVGIMVGAVAIALMVAAFALWYRRFKQNAEYGEKSPRPKQKALSSAGTTAGGTGDFSTMNSTRMRNNRTDLLATGPGTNQSGTWDDPTIVANKIPLEKVETQALISRGGYGEVYRGLYKGQVVAIKKLLPATRKDLKHIEAFFAEVKLMIALEHTRIVQFIGVAWDSLSDVCVLSEFMDGGDLRTLLMRFEVQEERPHGFDFDKLQIALHVVHALTYLHSLQPIVLHRDLKSKNILLDSQWHAKLTDFGVSREQSDATMTAGVGTSLWMAPEVMMGEKYDDKADIFSFGVVLSELDSHMLPYSQAKHADSGHKLTDTAILQLVSMGKLRVEFSESVLPELRELGEACVAVEPRERPSAAEILYKLQLALKQYR